MEGKEKLLPEMSNDSVIRRPPRNASLKAIVKIAEPQTEPHRPLKPKNTKRNKNNKVSLLAFEYQRIKASWGCGLLIIYKISNFQFCNQY